MKAQERKPKSESEKERERMSTELKSNRVIHFNGDPDAWEGWSEKTLARGRRKGYRDLLTGRVRIPTAREYELALLGDSPEDRETVRIAQLNEEAFEDIILSIDHTTKHGKIAFRLVKNCKSAEFPEGNAKLAWDRLNSKYESKTVPSLLKLKKNFANSKLESVENNPDEWISELESMRNEIDKINLSTQMSDQDFMIHVLNNLPVEYDVVLDGMESRLLLANSDPKKLTIEDIRAKLNNQFDRIDERENENNENVAYFAKSGKYEGYCAKCGKYGHHESVCRSNQNGDAGKGGRTFLGTCYHCGKKGHRITECSEYLKMREKNDMAKYAIPGYNEELGF